ncbi:MAG: hypothetical protein Q8R28_05545 [Dehalococcoidia bacterium]|nr:hypothetical protein [Dehalococcoidia bacterium]
MGEVRDGAENGGGGDVDYLTLSLGLHCGQDRPGAEEAARQIHSENPIPFLQVDLFEGAEGIDAGVVYQCVYPAKSRHGALGHLPGAGLVRDIGANGQGLAPAGFDLPGSRLGAFQIDVRDSHHRPRLCQRKGVSPPETLARASDQNYLAREIECHGRICYDFSSFSFLAAAIMLCVTWAGTSS